jgi:oxidoreductase
MTLNIKKCAISIEAKILTRATLQTQDGIISYMKTVLITGASDGLGFATAQLLLEKGYNVYSLSRSKPTDNRIKHITLDLTDEMSIKSAAQQILELDDQIMTLVNCAGIMSRFDRTDEKLFSDIIKVYSTNIMGVIYLTNFLMDRIVKDEADIINVASTAGTKGSANEPVYTSSKWAMRGYSKSLQMFFKGKRSRAISFCPGGMRNRMLEKITGEQLPDPENWMPVEIVAKTLVDVIETPKQAEISEIVINRK